MDKLLIATMHKFAYFNGKETRILHEGDLSKGTAHYYGVTWDDAGHIFLSANIDTRYIIRRFSAPSMEELPVMPEDRFLLHETHQMYWHDGVLYVANTGLNRVEILDNWGWRYKAWNPSTCDQEHISSLWCDGKYMYVVEHRQALRIPSAIRICEIGTLEVIATEYFGPGIHNIYKEDKCLYTLASNPHAMILVKNLVSGELRQIDKPEWGKTLTRGLARTEESWYVGLSLWEQDETKRHVGDAIILQLDNDFREVGRLTLKDYGPVCEIRVIGVMDFAHNNIILEAL